MTLSNVITDGEDVIKAQTAEQEAESLFASKPIYSNRTSSASTSRESIRGAADGI